MRLRRAWEADHLWHQQARRVTPRVGACAASRAVCVHARLCVCTRGGAHRGCSRWAVPRACTLEVDEHAREPTLQSRGMRHLRRAEKKCKRGRQGWTRAACAGRRRGSCRSGRDTRGWDTRGWVGRGWAMHLTSISTQWSHRMRHLKTPAVRLSCSDRSGPPPPPPPSPAFQSITLELKPSATPSSALKSAAASNAKPPATVAPPHARSEHGRRGACGVSLCAYPAPILRLCHAYAAPWYVASGASEPVSTVSRSR